MTSYVVNQQLKVVDASDNKARLCKVAAVDKEKQMIRVHYVNWNNRHDEWIDFCSERIVESDQISDNESEEHFHEACNPEDRQKKEIIGRLIDMSSDNGVKSVFSAFRIQKNQDTNEKNISNLF